ncbi:regulator of chromosome condensation 1/beta-lactamase-inhibitor protein II [Apiospora hydei]|uniref:Regulator of chromosome condensation 1/beta-lactamase-inhibitor protein II n=1 Tax=Apiospora hydei TaxID=1337664 RepID=A0ABR1XD77_9PEZI
MELYASGNNAWNQLVFGGVESASNEPTDFASFQLVLRDPVIERPHASLACTCVNTSNGIQTAGFPEDWMQSQSLKDRVLQSLAAIAGNGTIAVYDGQAVRQYQSVSHFQHGTAQRVFTSMRNVSQIVAYETGFAALSTTGQVWTWGDERYEACLCRDVSDVSLAEEPGTVAELEGLPTGKVKKLAAAGYLLMALTEGNDLYAWGGRPGLPGFLDDISASPSPVVIEDHDVADCAIGQSHAVVLTMSGEVYTAGANGNGQLGITTETDSPWSRVPFSPGSDATILSVACGPRNSFMIVQKPSRHT